MLEPLARERITRDIHRFANVARVSLFAAKKGLTMDEVTDVIKFNRDDITRDLMKGPFERKSSFGYKFGPPTRFSDGDWPVLYGAIGRTTAGKEVAHHYGRKAAGNGAASRPVHYSIVRYRFSGEVKDLRPKLHDWPKLISVDYTFCNGLGKEAYGAGLGAFLAPSAQHSGGTTVPVFIEETLSSPVIEATARLTFNGGTLTDIMELPGTKIWP